MPGAHVDGKTSLLGVADGSQTGQANMPDTSAQGSEMTKPSPRRKANLPARDSPEQSEVSIQSTRKPDKIVRSTLAAEKVVRAGTDVEKTQGLQATNGEEAATRKKLNAFKMEVPEVTQLESPRAGPDQENLRGSLNRFTKTKGRHSEKDSPSLYRRSSKAQGVSAGQTARNRHETEEHELGHFSGAIDSQSQPFDNDYATMPNRIAKAKEKHQNSAAFKRSRRMPAATPPNCRQTDPMLLYWNQNNAFLK